MENAAETALNQYLACTRALLTDCEKWSTGLGLNVTHGQTAINEERHGQYQAPTLILNDNHGKNVAEIVPFGASILSAWGRVDVIGEYGKREKIVYLTAGGPTITTRIQVGCGGKAEESSRRLYRAVDAEGWYWVSPSPIRRAYPLTQEVSPSFPSSGLGTPCPRSSSFASL